MSSFRNVVQRNPSERTHHAPQPATPNTSASASASDAPAPPAPTPSSADDQRPEQGRTQHATSSSTPSGPDDVAPARPPSSGDSDSNSLPRPPVFFRLPFNGPDGNPALLAFHPQPLPRNESDSRSAQSSAAQQPNGVQPSSTTSPPTTPERHQSTAQAGGTATGQPATNPGVNPARPQSHPHPEGHVPISPLFVPFGASPLPFSFIYDANTQTAWPIAQVTPGSPPGGPSPDAPESQQPRLVAGPPFRIILDIHFAAPPEPEQPDPEKAAKYVKQLERADAELRARMARLGMGSIGGFANTSGGDDQDALLGCGVCLDNYEAEDRPEWIDGPKSQDEAVVAVPCHGHHTLHAGCLRDWLAKLPPSQWTCPFCRASLDPGRTHRLAPESGRNPSKSASSSSPAVYTTLREEVRARERQRGWICDAPVCGHLDLPETGDGMATDLIKLTPCRHQVHLDCLCTSMRVENDLTGSDDFGAILDGDKDASSDAAAQATAQSSEADLEEEERTTVGKWVTCPTCRKEGWAELPLRRRPQRSAHDASAQRTTQDVSSESLAALESSKEPALTLEQLEATSANKVSHVQDATDQALPDSADASADPDEEAAVDAMLLPS